MVESSKNLCPELHKGERQSSVLSLKFRIEGLELFRLMGTLSKTLVTGATMVLTTTLAPALLTIHEGE